MTNKPSVHVKQMAHSLSPARSVRGLIWPMNDADAPAGEGDGDNGLSGAVCSAIWLDYTVSLFREGSRSMSRVLSLQWRTSSSANDIGLLTSRMFVRIPTNLLRMPGDKYH